MSDNDRISREKLLHTLEGWLKLNARVVPTEIGKAVYMMIADYPAVPREMSAREFVRALFRLTNDFNDERWDVFCRYQQATTPDEAVAIVEKWAREHPGTDVTTAKYALPRIDLEERSEK